MTAHLNAVDDLQRAANLVRTAAYSDLRRDNRVGEATQTAVYQTAIAVVDYDLAISQQETNAAYESGKEAAATVYQAYALNNDAGNKVTRANIAATYNATRYGTHDANGDLNLTGSITQLQIDRATDDEATDIQAATLRNTLPIRNVNSISLCPSPWKR